MQCQNVSPKCVTETSHARQELCAFLSSPSLFIIQDSIREGTTMKPFIDITYAAGHRHCRNAMRRYSPTREPPSMMSTQKGDYPILHSKYY